MSKRGYGQFCGLARALEVVGERWTLLVLRDLFVGPKRFSDLHHGLPGIPTNILTERLKGLEGNGVIRRRVLPRPVGSVVYELTEYGSELEDALTRLGLWGAKAMGEPRAGEIVTVDALIMAMRSTFHPAAARAVKATYEVRVGDIVIHLGVDRGRLEAAAGPLPDADLAIETGPAMRALLSGDVAPARAVKDGILRITGDRALLQRFVEMFRIEPMPSDRKGARGQVPADERVRGSALRSSRSNGRRPRR